MLPQALPTGAEQVTVTDTATSLLDLIRTAASDTGWMPPNGANTVWIQVDSTEADSLRYSLSYDPTAAKGMELFPTQNSEVLTVPLDKLKLIRTGSNDITINIQLFSRSPGGYNY